MLLFHVKRSDSVTIPSGPTPSSPRTAGDLASLDDAYDAEATPLARAAQHSLLARQTRPPPLVPARCRVPGRRG